MAVDASTFLTYDAAGNREDLSDVIYRISPTETPFMSGIEKSALELNAHALSGAAEQVAKWWLENDHISRETVVDLLTSLLWAGFGRQRASN